LGSGESWHENGYVERLADQFKVVCVDSLGHGQSDKPATAKSYHQSERAGDIVAVIDAVGEDRAHLIDYSMVGWLSAGVARFICHEFHPCLRVFHNWRTAFFL